MKIADLAEVYYLRRGHETRFEFTRERLQLEFLTGVRLHFIVRDVCATVHLLSVAFDFANESDEAALGRTGLRVASTG